MDQVISVIQRLEATSQHKDRVGQSLLILQSILLPSSSSLVNDLVQFGQYFLSSSSPAVAIGRRVLSAYTIALCGGSGLDPKHVLSLHDAVGPDNVQFEHLGEEAFKGENGREKRGDILERLQLMNVRSGWHDEQTTVLRYLHAHLLQEEEDWEGAAKVLMNIPLEGGTRLVGDEEKLSVYMTIVRLLLECGEWGQAQTYFTRASMLIHLTNDKTTQLSYRLAQARIFDFSARFNEAAQRYHELSFDKDIDEGERMQMLRAAVITSILAPSGPQRSRSLTTLNRDDRLPSLTPALTVMLRKMLLESIVRPSELHTFEDLLEPHQRAIVEGGGTVLERAVREHNVAACAKLYSNISFVRLGEILGYDETSNHTSQTTDPIDFIETMVRRMIEQGRLRGWMDQPRHLVYFEDREEDEEGKQVAGGLGVVSGEQGIGPVSWTERWDGRIRDVSLEVDRLAGVVAMRHGIKVGG